MRGSSPTPYQVTAGRAAHDDGRQDDHQLALAGSTVHLSQFRRRALPTTRSPSNSAPGITEPCTSRDSAAQVTGLPPYTVISTKIVSPMSSRLSSRGRCGWGGLAGEGVVDGADELAFEGAHGDFPGVAGADSSLEVGAGGWVDAQLGDG